MIHFFIILLFFAIAFQGFFSLLCSLMPFPLFLISRPFLFSMSSGSHFPLQFLLQAMTFSFNAVLVYSAYLFLYPLSVFSPLVIFSLAFLLGFLFHFILSFSFSSTYSMLALPSKSAAIEVPNAERRVAYLRDKISEDLHRLSVVLKKRPNWRRDLSSLRDEIVLWRQSHRGS